MPGIDHQQPLASFIQQALDRKCARRIADDRGNGRLCHRACEPRIIGGHSGWEQCLAPCQQIDPAVSLILGQQQGGLGGRQHPDELTRIEHRHKLRGGGDQACQQLAQRCIGGNGRERLLHNHLHCRWPLGIAHPAITRLPIKCHAQHLRHAKQPATLALVVDHRQCVDPPLHECTHRLRHRRLDIGCAWLAVDRLAHDPRAHRHQRGALLIGRQRSQQRRVGQPVAA